jgi:hypothetical protein
VFGVRPVLIFLFAPWEIEFVGEGEGEVRRVRREVGEARRVEGLGG